MSSFGLRVVAGTSRAARAAAVCSQSCRVRSRALHQRKQLSYPVEEGLGTFLPPGSLKLIAEDYQQGLLDRLNDQVRGTALENKSIVQTIVNAARDPSKVLEFNYASEALNNSFFLESLRPPPANATSHEAALLGTELLKRIRFSYGSLAHFQSSFGAAVLGMFSSGWIWLVTDQDGQLGIVPTFSAGTLLVHSSKASLALEEWQRLVGGELTDQFFDPLAAPADGSAPSIPPPPPPSSHLPPPTQPTPTSPVSGLSHGAPAIDPHTPARSYQYHAAPKGMYDPSVALNESKLDPKKLGETLYPLLCVSVHEHAWVSAGYGVWGKEEYMKRFWSVVDWHKVNSVFNKVRSNRAA